MKSVRVVVLVVIAGALLAGVFDNVVRRRPRRERCDLITVTPTPPPGCFAIVPGPTCQYDLKPCDPSVKYTVHVPAEK